MLSAVGRVDDNRCNLVMLWCPAWAGAGLGSGGAAKLGGHLAGRRAGGAGARGAQPLREGRAAKGSLHTTRSIRHLIPWVPLSAERLSWAPGQQSQARPGEAPGEKFNPGCSPQHGDRLRAAQLLNLPLQRRLQQGLARQGIQTGIRVLLRRRGGGACPPTQRRRGALQYRQCRQDAVLASLPTAGQLGAATACCQWWGAKDIYPQQGSNLRPFGHGP